LDQEVVDWNIELFEAKELANGPKGPLERLAKALVVVRVP